MEFRLSSPPSKNRMPKKEKSKVKGGGEQSEIPAEWVGKSVDELKLLVAQYESELLAARNSRNLAQVEHLSLIHI